MLKRLHLRQFLALVETGSFTAAANQLHVTQPTLSAGIAELERTLGTRIILRERRALRLTDAGNRLLMHARAIEREFRLAEGYVLTPPSPLPALRLGVLATISTTTISSIAARYGAEHEATHSTTTLLNLTDGSDADLRRRLAGHRLDAALTILRTAEQVECLLDEGYGMILPRTHRLADRVRLLPEELAGEIMIARRSCEVLAETSRFFTARGVRPRFSFRGANDDRCLALVEAGAGMTTGPFSLASPGTVAVTLKEYDFRRRIGLVIAAGQEELVEASGIQATIRAAIAHSSIPARG